MAQVVLLGSITDIRPEHEGRVVVAGSHGGHYPAAVASAGGVRAVILNDAGIGRDRAGVAGVMRLAQVGCAAAAADAMSCRIGSADDMMAAGRISVANSVAERLGLRPGQSVAEAADLMQAAEVPWARLPVPAEARQVVRLGTGREVRLLDSASLVSAEDAGAIVVTGSHGGLIGNDPARALKAPARCAVFNDAGFGKDRVGTGRLPALEAQGIAAVTVSHDTARIGEAGSALATGVISAANGPARDMGAAEGAALRAMLEALRP